MLSYIIPVVVVTVLFILYGILNVEEDASSEKKPGGCEHCGEKESCGSGGHDDFVHFSIHKPEMNPSREIFGRKPEK